MMSLNPSFEATYQALSAKQPGLSDLRLRESTKLQKLGLPTRKDERWRYTNLTSVLDGPVRLLSANSEKLPARDAFPVLGGATSACLTFYNGRFVPQWSNLGNGSGFTVQVLSQSASGSLDDFNKALDRTEETRDHGFAVMNTAYLEDAILISVRPGQKIEEPIAVLYFSDASQQAQGELALVTPRVHLQLGKGAEASLLEMHSGQGNGRYLSNGVTDLRVDSAARLSYCKIQMEAFDGHHIGTTRVEQARDSFTEVYNLSLGAKLSRQNLMITLAGEGAESVLDGLYLVNGQQHVDNYTLVDHAVPHTTSSQIYKGILDDEARAVFNGHVKIRRDAQKSNASQLNNNLIMSKKAEADTKPELEIDADDVKAAHGAAIGQIDPEHVFYLQARAIPKAEAIKMLARGFALEIPYRIQNDKLRQHAIQWVDQRISEMQVGEKHG